MAHPARPFRDLLASGALLVLLLTGHPAQAAATPDPTRPAAKPSGPSHAVTGLVGESPDQVREALGEPDVAQIDGAGALWTYRLDDCALMLAFRDGAGGLRVSEVMSGARRRGDKPPSPSQCVQSGEAAHRAGQGAAAHPRSPADPAAPLLQGSH